MADAGDTIVGGVTLAQFAFLRAGLADGLLLEELLGFLRLDAPVWEAAESAWDERVLDALESEDLALLQAIDGASEEARTHWSWRIPPLDEDLRAWFDTLHAWWSEVDPEAFLGRMGLGAAALAHLHRLWAGRLMRNPQLREEAAQLLREERREPPVPAPEAPRLARPARAEPAGDNVTVDIPTGKRATLPFAEGEPRLPLPRLAVPLPRRKRPRATAPGVDETRLGAAAPSAAPMPFVARPTPPTEEPAPEVVTAGPPVNVAEEPLVAPSEPAAAAQTPEVAPSAPRVLEPTLILPGTRAMLAPADALDADGAVDLDRTTAIRREDGAVIPLAEAFREPGPAAGRPALSLEQHAELTAALTIGSDLRAVLTQNGLTLEAKKREDEHWASELQRDPSAREKWMQAFTAARARLTAGDKKP